MSEKKTTVAAVIPARIGSTRIPRKPLQMIGGREVILRVCDAISRARRVDEVIVATDDMEIRDRVASAGYETRMTSPDHPTGTDRVAEAVRSIGHDLVVNVQGDEPFLPAAALDDLLGGMIEDRSIPMGTLVVPLEGERELHDPNVVKVVTDRAGMALYFSRAPVPHSWRGEEPARWKHVGIYAFRRETLLRFVSLPRTELEMTEGLEQLRALAHGIPIRVAFWPDPFHGVETMEDLERAREMVAAEERSAAGEDAGIDGRENSRQEGAGS